MTNVSESGIFMADAKHLTIEQIQAIEKTLDRGLRLEIVPMRDGIKIYTVKRKEVNN